MIDESLLKRAFGSKLRELRTKNGYRQADLATLVGLERTSITNIESGKQMVTVPLIYKLCQVFQVSVSDMMPNLEDMLVHKVSASQQSQSIEIGRKTMAAINRVRGG